MNNGNMSRRISSSLLALSISACGLLQTTQASADSPFYFEMDFKQQRVDLETNSQLKANSFGFRYREYLTENTGIDMTLGRLGVDNANDSNAFGYSPAGYHVGLGLSASTAVKQRFQAGFDVSYSYYDVSQELDDEKIDISWTQSEARLWLAMQLTPRLKAYGCAFAVRLDGKQKRAGTLTAETLLDNQDNDGQCGGLSWETEGNGLVGIEANGGALRGGRIYFGKRFH